jgi:GntR family transcriptional regulator
MHMRVADDLRERIHAGEFAPGSQLPTETELRAGYQVSRNTIRDAIKNLVSLGLIETRPGRGTFVATRIDPFVIRLSADSATGQPGDEHGSYVRAAASTHREERASSPRIEIQKAYGVIADQLQIPGEENERQVVSRHQERFIDGIPYSFQTSFYPMKFALEGASRLLEASVIEEGTTRYLADVLGLRQIDYRDLITLRSPNQNEMAFFQLPSDGRVPVFEIFRTAFDQTASPMRVTVTVYPSDRNQFVIDTGEVPVFEG